MSTDSRRHDRARFIAFGLLSLLDVPQPDADEIIGDRAFATDGASASSHHVGATFALDLDRDDGRGDIFGQSRKARIEIAQSGHVFGVDVANRLRVNRNALSLGFANGESRKYGGGRDRASDAREPGSRGVDDRPTVRPGDR